MKAVVCLALLGTVGLASGGGKTGGGGTTTTTTIAGFAVSQETVPAGSVAQVKVFLTEPKPISGGSTSMSFDPSFFDAALGIAMFSPTGDVHGTALYRSGGLSLHCVSPNGTYGTTSKDYPILTIAVPVKSTLAVGTKTKVTLDPTSTFWQDALGANYPIVEIKPGSVTVGGVVSISNVVPGGGTIAPGQFVYIYGTGFDPTALVQIDTAPKLFTQYVDSHTLRIWSQSSYVLDGSRVKLSAKAGSAVYYSYMRGVAQGSSSLPLIASTVPVFSVTAFTDAKVPGSSNPQLVPAVAVQNPGSALTNVDFDFYVSTSIQSVVHTTISLPPGAKYSRSLDEIAGVTLPWTFVRVRAASGVQVLGMLADLAAGDVFPVAPVVTPAGTL